MRRVGVGSVSLSALEKQYVNEVLDSGRLSYGPFSERFEKEFAASIGCDDAVLVNSGTDALRIAVHALYEERGWTGRDLGYGRYEDAEVICPASTFVATANVILQNDLCPVFVDVEPETYNLDPSLIEAAITDRTVAIMVAHLYGQPASMRPICQIADDHNLSVIEDSCETMSARYMGACVGSFGDIAAFSTYSCHIMSTGVGGIVTTNDTKLTELARSLANHGRAPGYFSMGHGVCNSDKELKRLLESRFRFERLGYSSRLTEMEAAIGCGQMQTLAQNVARRREIAQKLIEGLPDEFFVFPYKFADRDHSYMMFPLIIGPFLNDYGIYEQPPFTRAEFTLGLEKRGIETRPMLSFLDQPVYIQMFGDILRNFPVSANIAKNGFYIGCHPHMDDSDVAYVLESFREVTKEVSHGR